MRQARLVLDHGACYHCISRVVDRRFIFEAAEKRFFRATMRRLEAFLGVRVLTYCLMSNHFHLLVEVPDPDEVEALTLESLRQRLPRLYRGAALAMATDEINRAEASAASVVAGSSLWGEEILARYQARMGSLSVFLKELKQRFTQWYNTHHERCGTLWEDRFKSVLVEGDEHALMTMAAYIELNPVRAGLVGDPKDYPWCGYAEAVAGKRLARRNLSAMHARTRAWQGRSADWREVAPVYRVHLFGKGERRLGDGQTGAGARSGIDARQVRQVVEVEGGRLPLAELLRCRVRYFCDGAVFGSVGFVNGVFEAHRERFGANRESGARAMRGAEDWGGLATMRDLRKGVFGEEA